MYIWKQTSSKLLLTGGTINQTKHPYAFDIYGGYFFYDTFFLFGHYVCINWFFFLLLLYKWCSSVSTFAHHFKIHSKFLKISVLLKSLFCLFKYVYGFVISYFLLPHSLVIWWWQVRFDATILLHSFQ